MKLTKANLIQAVERRLELSRSKSNQIINVIIESIVNALSTGEDVRLSNFGKFQVREKAGRKYHLPGRAESIDRGPSKVIQFTAFKYLKEQVVAVNLEDLEQLSRYMPAEERREKLRKEFPSIGTAIIRISGIPVCEFKIKDISEGGSAILVEKDSMTLRNVRVGQEIDIRLNHGLSSIRPGLQRSRIVHITKADAPDLQGYYLLGIRTLGKIPI